MELTWADPKIVNSSGRPFNCSICLKQGEGLAKLRRCKEDRLDFTVEDGPTVFPIKLSKDSARSHGFCPAKAMFDFEAQQLFQLLMVCAETKTLYNEGGISNQPHWFIELLVWFLPAYDQEKFMSRAKSVLGGSEKNKTQGAKSGNNKGRLASKGRARLKRR